MSRQSVLQQIAQDFSDIYPHVKQFYGVPSSLIYNTGKRVARLSSSQGVHQGDPLGPALFSADIQPILSQMSLERSDVVILAYLDDIYVVGPANALDQVLCDFKVLLSRIGLIVCDRKCELYCPQENQAEFPVSVSYDGVTILGTPIGKPEYVRSQCIAIARSGEQLCCQLTKLDSKQCSMLILRHCHVPRMNYLARQVFPANLEEAARIHDSMTKSTFVSIIGSNFVNDDSWRQATLKIKLGGFGLTPVSQVSHASFLSSWCQTIKDLPCRFSSHSNLVNYLSASESVIGSIGFSVMSSFKSLPTLPKSDGENPDHQPLEDYIPYPKKLQQRLSNKIANDIAADLIANSQSERTAASYRLRSVQSRGAGGWLEVIPTSDKYAIRSNEFSLASHLRLGLALPFTNFINECDCGKELDKNEYHLLTCKYGGGPVWSHNCIVDGWTECLSDLHIPYQVEPRHHYTNTDNRPDITIFGIETGQTLDLDISLAHPWSVDNVKRASRIDGFAASTREDKKKAKYSEHQLPGG